MKKLLLPLLITLFLSSSYAGYSQQGFKLGAFVMPQAVFLLNDVDLALDDDAYKLEFLGGMSGGLVLGYNFNDFAGLRLNVLYAQDGGKYSSRRDISARNNFVNRVEYIKIPLMIGFNTQPFDRKLMFTMYAGGQVSFLTRAFSYDDNPVFDPGLPSNISNFPSTYGTYSSFNYSIVGDIGFDIYLTSETVVNLHIRTDYGLNDAENKDASFLLSEGGTTSSINYWNWTRGGTTAGETHGLAIGLKIGLTYTFGSAY